MITKCYSVKLTNYSAENMSKEFLIKSLKEKLRNVDRIIEDSTRDKHELEEAIRQCDKLEGNEPC
jgi:hypothetical protein